MRVPMTEYLEIDLDSERWNCRVCGHDLAPARGNYKEGTLVHDRDPGEIHRPLIDPARYEFTFAPDPAWCRILEFYCPGCGILRGIHDVTRGDLGAALGSNLLFFALVAPVMVVAWALWAHRAWTGRSPSGRQVGRARRADRAHRLLAGQQVGLAAEHRHVGAAGQRVDQAGGERAGQESRAQHADRPRIGRLPCGPRCHVRHDIEPASGDTP